MDEWVEAGEGERSISDMVKALVLFATSVVMRCSQRWSEGLFRTCKEAQD